MIITHLTPACRCLACGSVLDAATAAIGDDSRQPHPGDITICFECGELMGFNADGTVRGLTAEEQRGATSNLKILMLQAAVRTRPSRDR